MSINPESTLSSVQKKAINAWFLNKRKLKKHNKIPFYINDYSTSNKNNPTDAELEMMDWLSHYSIKYKFQYPINNNGRFYIVDFFIKTKTSFICLEIDGGYHKSKKMIKQDRVRDMNILKMGFIPMRYDNDVVFNRGYEIIGVIQSIL